jgi:hypothetical protein
MQPGAVFGLVVPQTLLHSRNSVSLRGLIAKEFELQEICLLPDRVFKFSDAESALLIGRRRIGARGKPVSVRYRRVRERDVAQFRQNYATTSDRVVQPDRFADAPEHNMRLPDLEWIWAHLGDLSRLENIAQLGQGLFYRGGEELPSGAVTVSKSRFAGAVKGFASWRPNTQVHELPEEVWMNLDPSVADRRVTGANVGIPQVLLNYARVSRGPWCLEALIDREGHAVTSRFITVRSLSDGLPLEFLWAVCNSPLANAYVYAHSMQRDILVGLARRLPVPPLARGAVDSVCAAAHNYLAAAASTAQVLEAGRDEAEIRNLLLRLDAEVLRLYELPARYERQILDLFCDWTRPGVPVHFCGYFPQDFEPCVSLHDYISNDYVRSTAGALNGRYEPVKDPDLLRALRHASEDYRD